jgi:hypothetical protein
MFMRPGTELTVMWTAADVAVEPRLSVTTAVSVYVPAATLVQAMLYGLVVSEPID